MSKTFVIADTHFGWRGRTMEIVRPAFKGDGTRMDKMMVELWNSEIAPDDIVFHLGDACMCNKAYGKRIFDVLNGKKILIRGNHDSGYHSMQEVGFDAVMEECVISIKGYPILLTHRPRQYLPPDVSGIFCGHIHEGAPEDLYEAGECIFVPPFCVNVCVEETKYKPTYVKDAFGKLKLRVRGTEYEKKIEEARISRRR